MSSPYICGDCTLLSACLILKIPRLQVDALNYLLQKIINDHSHGNNNTNVSLPLCHSLLQYLVSLITEEEAKGVLSLKTIEAIQYFMSIQNGISNPQHHLFCYNSLVLRILIQSFVKISNGSFMQQSNILNKTSFVHYNEICLETLAIFLNSSSSNQPSTLPLTLSSSWDPPTLSQLYTRKKEHNKTDKTLPIYSSHVTYQHVRYQTSEEIQQAEIVYKGCFSLIFWNLVLASLFPIEYITIQNRNSSHTNNEITAGLNQRESLISSSSIAIDKLCELHQSLRDILRTILRSRLKQNFVYSFTNTLLLNNEEIFTELILPFETIDQTNAITIVHSLKNRMLTLAGYSSLEVFFQQIFPHVYNNNEQITLRHDLKDIEMGEVLLYLCVLGTTKMTSNETTGMLFCNQLVAPSLKFVITQIYELLMSYNNEDLSLRFRPTLFLLRSILLTACSYTSYLLLHQPELFETCIKLTVKSISIPQKGDTIVTLRSKEDHLGCVTLMKFLTELTFLKNTSTTLPSFLILIENLFFSLVEFLDKYFFNLSTFHLTNCSSSEISFTSQNIVSSSTFPLSSKSYSMIYISLSLCLKYLEQSLNETHLFQLFQIFDKYNTLFQHIGFNESLHNKTLLFLHHRYPSINILALTLHALLSSLIEDPHSEALRIIGFKEFSHTTIQQSNPGRILNNCTSLHHLTSLAESLFCLLTKNPYKNDTLTFLKFQQLEDDKTFIILNEYLTYLIGCLVALHRSMVKGLHYKHASALMYRLLEEYCKTPLAKFWFRPLTYLLSKPFNPILEPLCEQQHCFDDASNIIVLKITEECLQATIQLLYHHAQSKLLLHDGITIISESQIYCCIVEAIEGLGSLLIQEEVIETKDTTIQNEMESFNYFKNKNIFFNFLFLTDIILKSTSALGLYIPIKSINIFTHIINYFLLNSSGNHDVLFIQYFSTLVDPTMIIKTTTTYETNYDGVSYLTFHLSCLLIFLSGLTAKDIGGNCLLDAIQAVMELANQQGCLYNILHSAITIATKENHCLKKNYKWMDINSNTAKNFLNEICQVFKKPNKSGHKAQLRSILRKFCYCTNKQT